jgi:hypothetical protein
MPRDRRSLIVESISLAVWWSRRVRMGWDWCWLVPGYLLMRRLAGFTVSLCKRYAEMRGCTTTGRNWICVRMKNTIPRQCRQEAERHKIAARFSSSRTNRRALAPGRARSFTGSLLCSSNSLFTPASVPSAGPIPAVQPTTSTKNTAPPACAGGAVFFCAVGGGGGNRTRVRKHSTDSSTYLALSINLTWTTGMCTLCTSELPII